MSITTKWFSSSICLLAALCSLSPANAAFLDHGTYSTDSNTGLAWLDVTQTAGISFSDMQNGAGGWLSSGWRYATGLEVSNLFTTYVGSGSENWYQGSAYQNSLTLVRQLGVSGSFNNSEGITQIYGAQYPTQISIDARFNDGNSNDLVGLGELIARINDVPDSTVLFTFKAADGWFTTTFGQRIVRLSRQVTEVF